MLYTHDTLGERHVPLFRGWGMMNAYDTEYERTCHIV